jgi:hypothetical protein
VKTLIENWYWEDTWQGLCMAALLAIAILLGVMFTADHGVRRYYVRGGMSEQLTCVYAESDWSDDACVVCLTNAAEAVELARQANGLLK